VLGGLRGCSHVAPVALWCDVISFSCGSDSHIVLVFFCSRNHACKCLLLSHEPIFVFFSYFASHFTPNVSLLCPVELSRVPNAMDRRKCALCSHNRAKQSGPCECRSKVFPCVHFSAVKGAPNYFHQIHLATPAIMPILTSIAFRIIDTDGH
jgi:hypothetical protein